MFRFVSFLIHEGMLSEEAGKFLSVNVTEMIDLYLIGLVLIIIALGLYQLFIDPDLEPSGMAGYTVVRQPEAAPLNRFSRDPPGDIPGLCCRQPADGT